jgi:hypothetical protein
MKTTKGVKGIIPFAKPITERSLTAIHGEIHDNVELGSQLYSDDSIVFDDLDGLFFRHESVNHSAGEYARGPASTNSIESVWALLKRGIYGVYTGLSECPTLTASSFGSALLGASSSRACPWPCTSTTNKCMEKSQCQ